MCSLVDIVLCAGCFRAIDDFFGASAAHDTDNPRPEISFGIIVAGAVRSLEGYSLRLPPGYNGEVIDRTGPGHHQTPNGMATFVISDPLPVMMTQQQGPFWT